jgi:hypothetical protein
VGAPVSRSEGMAAGDTFATGSLLDSVSSGSSRAPNSYHLDVSMLRYAAGRALPR